MSHVWVDPELIDHDPGTRHRGFRAQTGGPVVGVGGAGTTIVARGTGIPRIIPYSIMAYSRGDFVVASRPGRIGSKARNPVARVGRSCGRRPAIRRRTDRRPRGPNRPGTRRQPGRAVGRPLCIRCHGARAGSGPPVGDRCDARAGGVGTPRANRRSTPDGGGSTGSAHSFRRGLAAAPGVFRWAYRRPRDCSSPSTPQMASDATQLQQLGGGSEDENCCDRCQFGHRATGRRAGARPRAQGGCGVAHRL